MDQESGSQNPSTGSGKVGSQNGGRTGRWTSIRTDEHTDGRKWMQQWVEARCTNRLDEGWHLSVLRTVYLLLGLRVVSSVALCTLGPAQCPVPGAGCAGAGEDARSSSSVVMIPPREYAGRRRQMSRAQAPTVAHNRCAGECGNNRGTPEEKDTEGTATESEKNTRKQKNKTTSGVANSAPSSGRAVQAAVNKRNNQADKRHGNQRATAWEVLTEPTNEHVNKVQQSVSNRATEQPSNQPASHCDSNDCTQANELRRSERRKYRDAVSGRSDKRSNERTK